MSKAPRRNRAHRKSAASRSMNNRDNQLRAITDPPKHEEDPIITLAEVARQTGLSRSTISRWVQTGAFEPDKILRKPNGLPAIRQSAINTFLAGTAYPVKTVTAPPEDEHDGVDKRTAHRD